MTRRAERGYSLVEVVAAMAIAGITLAGLVQAVGTNLRHAALTGEYTRATALAESMLSRVGTELPLVPGTRSGRFDGTFHWHRTIHPREDPDPGTGAPPLKPHEVAVTVWWRTGERTREVTLRTLRLRVTDE